MLQLSVIQPIGLGTSFIDYPDRESHAVVVYFCGCEQGCHTCHNPLLQDWLYGSVLQDYEFEAQVYHALDRHRTNKLVLTGGDPLYHHNIIAVREFLLKNQHKIDIAIYTGYDIHYVKEHKITGYRFLKCGTYDYRMRQQPEKTNTRFVLASENQKLYNRYGHCISRAGVYYFGGTSWIIKLKHWLQELFH